MVKFYIYGTCWFCLFSESQMFSLLSFQKRRRRIDRSMIGEPTNFVHTAHVGSGDLFSGMNSVSSIQNQMQSKGGYGGGMSANVQMQLVDTKAG
ncbi:C42S2 protein, partial [Chaetorhynchus papuensis]|nr:C42S2 protein [Chaetorhynchus papuensis]